MPQFSARSRERLDTAHHALQRLFNEVIRHYDCTVLEGYRPPDRQRELYEAGRSKVLRGRHNVSPSLAVDVAPWLPGRGVPWPKKGTKTYVKDICQFYHFAGFVEATARQVIPEYVLRWGGDWDRDHDLADQTFDDLVHFELRDGPGVSF
ncbi:MAG TPA: M15 family peptidase [Thermopetrobacter sp.]|nr:M15 family peptidase [Thermopetrobacter sp.]